MKKVAVGSKNPVKIEAVRQAFELVFKGEEFEISGVDVKSGISDQPMSDVESITGATNRAKAARNAQNADFGVGLDGGLQEVDGRWFDCGWIVVIDKNNDMGIGSTIRMQTPEKMLELIKQGMELGQANDVLFKKENTKQGDGHFGLMTNNAITRTTGYRDGVISALARFVHPWVFEE